MIKGIQLLIKIFFKIDLFLDYTKLRGELLLRHSAFVHDAELVVDTAPSMNRLIPFLRNLEGGKVQGFHESRTAWEDIPLTVKLLVTAVKAFNCIFKHLVCHI